jgi:tetratricopeptide (TPR) repeat protein
LTIDHHGYDGDQSHKAGRNLRLLHKQLVLDPERIYLWWHLGVVERDLGRLAEAEAAWLQGVDIARRGAARGPEIALCFIELAKVRLQRGEEALALALVCEAKQLQPHNLLLHWIEAQALVAAGRHREGFAIFARLASVDPDTLLAELSYDLRIFGAWAFAEMGRCAFRMGCYRESEDCYRRAEAIEPDCLEFRVKRQLAGVRATDAGRKIEHERRWEALPDSRCAILDESGTGSTLPYNTEASGVDVRMGA